MVVQATAKFWTGPTIAVPFGEGGCQVFVSPFRGIFSTLLPPPPFGEAADHPLKRACNIHPWSYEVVVSEL